MVKVELETLTIEKMNATNIHKNIYVYFSDCFVHNVVYWSKLAQKN